jgi:hypothetical protein
MKLHVLKMIVKMKKYIIGLILIVMSVTSYAQYAAPVDSFYIKHPELLVHRYRDDFNGNNNIENTILLYENYVMNTEVFEHQEKQVKGMVIGGSLMVLGTAGWIWTLLEDPPVYQTSNPALKEYSDKQKNKRLAIGLISTATFVSGTTVFAISFKHHKRIRAKVGLNILKLEFNLFDQKRYYNPGQKAPKELKHKENKR